MCAFDLYITRALLSFFIMLYNSFYVCIVFFVCGYCCHNIKILSICFLLKLNAKSSPIPREQGTTVDAVAVAVAAVVYHNRLYFKLRTVAIFVVAAAHDFMSFDKNFLFSLLNGLLFRRTSEQRSKWIIYRWFYFA